MRKQIKRKLSLWGNGKRSGTRSAASLIQQLYKNGWVNSFTTYYVEDHRPSPNQVSGFEGFRARIEEGQKLG